MPGRFLFESACPPSIAGSRYVPMGSVIAGWRTAATLVVAISMVLSQASCGGRSSAAGLGSESNREGGQEEPGDSTSCSDHPNVIACIPPGIPCSENPYVTDCVGPYPDGKVPCLKNPYVVDCVGPYPENF